MTSGRLARSGDSRGINLLSRRDGGPFFSLSTIRQKGTEGSNGFEANGFGARSCHHDPRLAFQWRCSGSSGPPRVFRRWCSCGGDPAAVIQCWKSVLSDLALVTRCLWSGEWASEYVPVVVRTAWSFEQVTNEPVIRLIRRCVEWVIVSFVYVALFSVVFALTGVQALSLLINCCVWFVFVALRQSLSLRWCVPVCRASSGSGSALLYITLRKAFCIVLRFCVF